MTRIKIWSVVEAHKHESILLAAARAFARLGFKKASIGEIARAAGVAKGTVYLACKNKEDLFYQAVLSQIREFVANTALGIDPRVNADELLKTCSVRAMKFLKDHPLVRDLVIGIHHGELPGWEERFDQLRALGHANIVQILRLGVQQGRFRADLDIEKTASVLQDMQDAGLIFHTRAKRMEDDALFARLDAGLDLVLHGLLAHETR